MNNLKYPDHNGELHDNLQDSLESFCDCPDCMETCNFIINHDLMSNKYFFGCQSCGFHVKCKDIRVFISVLTLVID